jgi:hypothetical protein
VRPIPSGRHHAAGREERQAGRHGRRLIHEPPWPRPPGRSRRRIDYSSE